MTDEEKIRKLTYDVYLTRYNREIEGITPGDDLSFSAAVTDTDALAEIRKTIAWTNMFLGELESETDSDSRPINWSFARENDVDLGSVSEGTTELDFDDDYLRPVFDEERPLTITFDGSVVSTWDVVAPNQLTKRSTTGRDDRVTIVNRKLIFGRPIKDTEAGGTVIADVINNIPRLTLENATAIDTVVPYQLLVLGVAKNATLPDIVQGGLSPSFVQKYADLLELVKRGNQNSTGANEYGREDLSYIGGIH